MRTLIGRIACCVCLATGGAGSAADEGAAPIHTRTQTHTQTASLVAEVTGRPSEILATAAGAAGGAPLELVHRVAFQPFDPDLGRLVGVRLEVDLAVEHAYAGSVSDGMPLDEAPEAVAVAPQLVTRLMVGFEEAPVAVAAVQSGRPGGCAAEGSCLFEHAERFAVSGLARDGEGLPPREVFAEGRVEAVLRLGLDTLVDPASRICDAGGTWYRCRLDDLRLAVDAPEGGIRLHYDYVPAATAPAASMSAVTFQGGNIDFVLSAGLAVLAAVSGIAAVALLRFDG